MEAATPKIPSRKAWITSRLGRRNTDLPCNQTKTGRSTTIEKVVRNCESINGLMSPSVSPPGRSLPVKMALPRLADIPHKRVAEAM